MPNEASGPGIAGPHQVLTFVLGGQTYGVDILRVQEIRGWSAVTQVPHTPAHVLGVMNLRGAIVPIVDLRKQFHLRQADYSPLTVIIVLSIHVRGGRRDVGVVVDGVSEVLDVKAADVRAAPDLGAASATEHIRGLLSVAELMITLLDIDRLIASSLTNSAGALTEAGPAADAA